MTTPIDAVPYDEGLCRTLQNAVELVGSRWTCTILIAGVQGARRFSEYRAEVTGISDRLLSQRLKELEAEGLIERTVIPSTPVQVRYAPSADADELIAAMQPLADWSQRRLTRTGQPNPTVPDGQTSGPTRAPRRAPAALPAGSSTELLAQLTGSQLAGN